ncbi:MAG TPA: site-2 protease family protein [Candidatus Nitrosopolaris sp.]|nr:site-2 protease family protein [Candidatus Nitrosopolaris sp.]
MTVDLQTIAILLVVLLFSMSIHEMMHAFTADWLGDDTARIMGRVTLNPLAHIDPFFTVALPLLLLLSHSPYLFGAAKPVQVNFHRLKYDEFGGAIVGMVGPLTNLVIAVVAALIFNHLSLVNGTAVYTIFEITILLNVGLFIFNSIPWPPLDGSRLLYAFAPRPLQELMESIEHLGMTGLVVFILIFYSFGGGIGNLMLHVVHYLAPTLIT